MDFREAEVWLTECGELRTVLGRQSVPGYKILDRFLRRLSEATLERTLSEGVRRLMAAEEIPRATVAIDATGLTPGAISTFFVVRDKDRDPSITWRHWLQWTMAVALDYWVILAQTARCGPYNGCATLRLLVDAAYKRVPWDRSGPMRHAIVSAIIIRFIMAPGREHHPSQTR